MNKYSFSVVFSCVIILSSCGNKSTESNEASKDSSIKEASAEVKSASSAELSGKALLIARVWKATEIETPTAKLSGEFISIKYDFKKDGSFEYSEDGKKESGKWKVNQEETMFTLEYSDARKADYDVKELSEEQMVIAGKEHGMYRTLTLASK